MKRLEIDYSLNAIDSLVSLSRYNFVNRTNPNTDLKVLDFGCGSGYGMKVLKEHFTKVYGYDEYPDSYLPKGFDIITDKSNLDNDFNIIVSFEVIEHIEKEFQEGYLKFIYSKLSENGLFYISTVRKIDPPPTENRRIEHKHELDFEQLYDLCANVFSRVITFGQIDQTISTFYKENTYHNLFICTK